MHIDSALAGCGSKDVNDGTDGSETSVSEPDEDKTKKTSNDMPCPETALQKNAYIFGKTQLDALSYAVGEEIRFDIRLTDSTGFLSVWLAPLILMNPAEFTKYPDVLF